MNEKTQAAFETYSDNKMAISDFIDEFERLVNKAKQYGANVSYVILKNANLWDCHKHLTRVAISELN